MADRVKRAACTVAEMAPGETKTIYYLHIPKAGGSTFVKMATHNADPFVPNRNGNPVFPTGDLVRFWEWSEQTQLRFLTAGPHPSSPTKPGSARRLRAAIGSPTSRFSVIRSTVL